MASLLPVDSKGCSAASPAVKQRQHQIFVKGAQRAIAEFGQTLQKWLTPTSDLSNFQSEFREALESLGRQRGAIARDAQVKDPDNYGRVFNGAFSCTDLFAQYQQYNEKAVKYIHGLLSKMNPGVLGFPLKEGNFPQIIAGLRVVHRVKILDSADINTFVLQTERVFDERMREYKLENPSSFEMENFVPWLRERYPIDFKNYNTLENIKALKARFPSPRIDPVTGQYLDHTRTAKSAYVVVTIDVQDPNTHEYVSLSQMTTWMYQNHKDNPVTRMLDPEFGYPVVRITHLRQIDINRLFTFVGSHFERFIRAHREGLPNQEKMERAALACYSLANGVLFCRGHASVSEWVFDRVRSALNITSDSEIYGTGMDLKAMTGTSRGYMKKYFAPPKSPSNEEKG